MFGNENFEFHWVRYFMLDNKRNSAYMKNLRFSCLGEFNNISFDVFRAD